MDAAKSSEVRDVSTSCGTPSAVYAFQQGESLVYGKEQMGPASIQITVDIYGQLVPGESRGAVDRLDDDASIRIPDASELPRTLAANGVKSFIEGGEPHFRELEPAGRVAAAS